MIEPLSERLAGYYPFHGARGAFLLQTGCHDAARVAFNQAIALAGSASEAGHIRRHLDRLLADSEARAKILPGDVGVAPGRTS